MGRIRRKRSGRGFAYLLAMHALGLGSCGEDTEGPVEERPVVVVPTTKEEVQLAYDALGNDCDGFVQRTFVPHEAQSLGSPRVLHMPETDPGRLFSMKRTVGWDPVVSILDMGFKGIADQFKTTSFERAQHCSAVRELFSPRSEELADGSVRRKHLSVILYGEDHARPGSYPENGKWPANPDVPVRLLGYLSAWTSRNIKLDPQSADELMFQHFPLHIACSESLSGRFIPLNVSARADVDESVCTRNNLEPDGLRCLAEVLEHRSGNECRFVALNVKATGDAGAEVVFSLGGTIIAAGDTSPEYKLRIDRMVIEEAAAHRPATD